MIRPLFILAALLASAYYAGDHALTRVQEAQALHCARASDGTDSSIANCYTTHGRPVPGDL